MSDYPTVPFSLGAGYIDDAEVNAVKAEVEAMQTDVAELKTKTLPANDGETGMEFLARAEVYDILTDGSGNQLVDDAGNQLFAPKYDSILARVEAQEEPPKAIIIPEEITEDEWETTGYTVEDVVKSFLANRVFAKRSSDNAICMCSLFFPTPDNYLQTYGVSGPFELPIPYTDFFNVFQNELKKG